MVLGLHVQALLLHLMGHYKTTSKTDRAASGTNLAMIRAAIELKIHHHLRFGSFLRKTVFEKTRVVPYGSE